MEMPMWGWSKTTKHYEILLALIPGCSLEFIVDVVSGMQAAGF